MDVHSILNGRWDFRVEHRGISIYSSKVEGSDVLGFKGVAEIPAGFRKLISLFHDTSSYGRWVHRLAEMEVLERNDSLEYVVRQVIVTSWPLQKREMFGKKGLKPAGENPVAVTITGVPDFLPPNPSYARVKEVQGLWVFTPSGPDAIHLTFVMHVDPGPDVPSAVSNQAMFEVPFYSMDNLRKLSADRSYNPPYPEEVDQHLCII